MSQSNIVQVGKPHRPLPVKMINFVGRAANVIGKQPVRIDDESLIKLAIKEAGSADFGGDDFREGLRRFCASVEREGQLTLLGRLMVQKYVAGNLANRLRLVEWRKQHPEIQNEKIVDPLFIVGPPRTGTTILHGLLEQDPVNRSPMFWEVQFPVPPARPDTWGSDPRIAEEQKVLDQLLKLVPGINAIHSMGPTMPQECVAVFTKCVMSEQLSVQFNVPAYRDWLDDQDMHPTYEFHKKFLQHLQSGGVRGGRWVLKSPAHLHLIDTIFDVYPDARIIDTHRDPIKVCTSIASLTAALRGISTDVLDLHAIGRSQVQWWAKLMARSLEQRKRLADRGDQFFDVNMSETVADPIDVVRRMYAHFGYPLTSEVESKMIAFMKDNTRDKHGSHTYKPEDFGIDPIEDRVHFEEYIEHFGL